MTKPISLSFLGSEDFFREYWQKKPLFLPQALPKFKSPISEDVLAGLACEPLIESRIVLEQGVTPWELRNGPFEPEIFQKLPETHWTLLVQAVNHWVPAVHRLLTHFQFLPSYYLKDIMVSYAAKQGSVGPHFDYYDVFILQGTGKRHWQLGEFCSPDTNTLTETPLGILQEFTMQEEYIMEPGDLLYLPQQQAHWCVTQDPGLSYSIGFRTPSESELLHSFSSEIMSHLNEAQRLKILPKSFAENPSEITLETLNNLQQIFAKLLNDPARLLDWAGRFLTEPKYPDLESTVIHKKYSKLAQQLGKYAHIYQNESSNFAYHLADDKVYLFVDGKSYLLAKNMEFLVSLICNNMRLNCKVIAQKFTGKAEQELLLNLLRQGALYFNLN